jgi:ferredoxin-NADP reductase
VNEAIVKAARVLTPTVTRYRIGTVPGRPALAAAVPGQHVTLGIGPRTKTFTVLAVEDGMYELAIRNRLRGDRRDVLSPRLFAGAPVRVGEPGGHFTAGHRVPFTHFLAAGVGVNPIVAVLAAGRVRGWRLTYVDRGEREFPFLARLRELAREQGGRVVTVDTGTRPRPDWAEAVAAIPAGSTIGACGPGAMVSAVRDAVMREPGKRRLVIDEPTTGPDYCVPEAVEVVCIRSGTTFLATGRTSLLEQLNERGVAVPSSCRRGLCGTCEVEVRSGRVDHRDEVLTEQEKADSAYILPCVSRSISPQLVLNV